MARRREDRTIGCLLCGDVLAIYEEGGIVPPTWKHQCATHRELYEAEEMLDEMRATRKPEG